MSASNGYTTAGHVRGACGHTHRTVRSVLACMDRDARSCTAVGGYSDRRPITLTEDVSADSPLAVLLAQPIRGIYEEAR